MCAESTTTCGYFCPWEMELNRGALACPEGNRKESGEVGPLQSRRVLAVCRATAIDSQEYRQFTNLALERNSPVHGWEHLAGVAIFSPPKRETDLRLNNKQCIHFMAQTKATCSLTGAGCSDAVSSLGQHNTTSLFSTLLLRHIPYLPRCLSIFRHDHPMTAPG